LTILSEQSLAANHLNSSSPNFSDHNIPVMFSDHISDIFFQPSPKYTTISTQPYEHNHLNTTISTQTQPSQHNHLNTTISTQTQPSQDNHLNTTISKDFGVVLGQNRVCT
jgi:hypothetical protein